MKSKLKFIILLISIILLFFAYTRKEEKLLTKNLRFNESTLAYKDGVLIANFGSSELNPLNQEGKGYITMLRGRDIKTIIPPDGTLNAPKGMLVLGDTLYICDVNQLVIYNLGEEKQAAKIIKFPEGELYLNDITSYKDDIYVTVTNSGNIFKLDKNKLSPKLWYNVVGANGILNVDDQMYVASYPADGNTCEDNVIYKISNLDKPIKERFIEQAGQWDGLAISDDKQSLYASNWSPAEVVAIDMNSKKIEPIKFKNSFVGAADFSLINGRLYVPDLVKSTLIIKEIK